MAGGRRRLERSSGVGVLSGGCFCGMVSDYVGDESGACMWAVEN